MRNFKSGDILHADDMNVIVDAVESAHSQLSECMTKAEGEDMLDVVNSSINDVMQIAEIKTTEAEVLDLITENMPTPNLSGLATEDFVIAKINEAELAGSEQPIDLSVYATKAELSTKVDVINGKGLSTADFTNVEKDKLSGIEAGAQKNPNLDDFALKSEIPAATAIQYNGVLIPTLRRYIYEVDAVGGEWSVDYADKNFTQLVTVYHQTIANGTSRSDRTISTLKQDQPTLTSCSGYLMSASSSSLLGIGTVLSDGDGKVRLIVEGV